MVKDGREVKYCKRMNLDFTKRYFEPRLAQELTSGTRLRWIMELIENRFEHMSKLRYFVIYESHKVGHRQRRAWGAIDLAACYPGSLGCSDINLRIFVRTPQGYTAPFFKRQE